MTEPAIPVEILAQFHDAPCLLVITPEACPELATMILDIVHVHDSTPPCGIPGPMPLCAEHGRASLRRGTGFLASYLGPIMCEGCHLPLVVRGSSPLPGRETP